MAQSRCGGCRRHGYRAQPLYSGIPLFRGYCHQKLCLLAEAAADLEMAAKLDQNHQNALYYLGQTYFYMGEYERALIALERLTHMLATRGGMGRHLQLAVSDAAPPWPGR